MHHWSAAFCARAIADLYARYPRLRIVFCANRKIAESWTRNHLAAVSAMVGVASAEAELAVQNEDVEDVEDVEDEVDLDASSH